jgi:hypothetical protein
MPTGIEAIDFAGQTVRRTAPHTPSFDEKIPSMDDLPFDHPSRLRKQVADEGVDMQKGAPFWQRMQLALKPNIPERRGRAMPQIMAEAFQQVPDDLPKFRYDSRLGEFQIMRPTNDGRFRWTSMDGTGIEMGDLGDMFNLGEIGSISGSVVGVGKGKVFTFGKLGPRGQTAVGGFAGGSLGRMTGEMASIVADYISSGGEEFPTLQQWQELGLTGAQLEGLATVFGELGAKILRSGSTAIQEGAARLQGKQAVFGDADQLAFHNKNLKETQEDMIRIKDTLGREDLAVTEGTASHSIDLIEGENFALKNAAKNTQRGFNKAQARSKRTFSDYVNKVWGGNEKFLGNKFGTIRAANDTLTDASVVVAQNTDGVLRFSSKADPTFGLNVNPQGTVWQAKLLDNDGLDIVAHGLNGTGIDNKLYIAAAEEAGTYGKALASDNSVTGEAYDVWKSLNGHPSIGKLEWNPTARWDSSIERWVTNDFGPVVKMADPTPISPLLLKEGVKVGRGAEGKFVAHKDLTRVMRQPGRKELGTIGEEIKNPFIKQDWKEAVLKDYETNVNVKGKFSEANFDIWKKETRRFNEEIFNPSEMARINQVGGLRAVVEGGRGAADNSLSTLARNIKVEPSNKMLKDPSQRPLWNQMKSLDRRSRQRTMKILDAQGQGDGIRALFKDELRLDLLNRTKGSNITGFDKWLELNRDLITDVMGEQRAVPYLAHLRTMGNVVKRRSDRAMVVGSAAEANPTMLGLTRVLFGPLSRAQRFFSAARKGQVRARSATIGDIITDPDLLKELVRIQTSPVASVQAARMMQRTGLVDAFWKDADTFSADNPEHRRTLAQIVYEELQTEFAEADAARE